MIELGPAELFRADAEGLPGDRTFYIHATANGEEYFFISEKQHVEALGEMSMKFLDDTSVEPDMEAVHRLSATLSQPLQIGTPFFRISGMQIALGSNNMISVNLQSIDPEDEEVTFEVAPEQLRAAAQHALYVVSNGRPICPDCHMPRNPDHHFCPVSDGYLN